MSDGRTYHPGGYIPPGRTQIVLGVAECIVVADDVRSGRYRCSRTDDAHLKAAHSDGENR